MILINDFFLLASSLIMAFIGSYLMSEEKGQLIKSTPKRRSERIIGLYLCMISFVTLVMACFSFDEFFDTHVSRMKKDKSIVLFATAFISWILILISGFRKKLVGADIQNITRTLIIILVFWVISLDNNLKIDDIPLTAGLITWLLIEVFQTKVRKKL